VAEQTLKDIGPVVLVGAGKMGLAMARGWITGGLPPDRLVLVDPFAGEPAQAFAQETGVRLLKSAELEHIKAVTETYLATAQLNIDERAVANRRHANKLLQ